MRTGRRLPPLLAAVLLAACVGLVGGAASAWALYSRLGPAERVVSIPAQPGSGTAPAAAGNSTYASLAQAAQPALVRVVTRTVSAADLASGTGGLATGFVVGGDGLVVTSAHAVVGATRLQVAYGDGALADATVAASDPAHGLVLLRPAAAQARTPAPLAFADFDRSGPRVGDLAIGVGLRPVSGLSVTPGTITATARTVPALLGGDPPVVGALTVDAVADPADDGAPLLDATGKVIGIITVAPFDGPPGLLALDGRAASDLTAAVSRGTTTSPTLGVTSEVLGPADAAAVRAAPGALVVALAPGGPAERAGLQAGDVVTTLNGVAVDGDHPLDATRRGLARGQLVRLGVLRGGRPLDLSLVVG